MALRSEFRAEITVLTASSKVVTAPSERSQMSVITPTTGSLQSTVRSAIDPANSGRHGLGSCFDSRHRVGLDLELGIFFNRNYPRVVRKRPETALGNYRSEPLEDFRIRQHTAKAMICSYL